MITSALDGKHLTFELGTETYGIDIAYVRQIISIIDITKIPEQPNYVKGVINLRGEIIPIVDLRLKFGKPEKTYDEKTCIIILDVKKQSVGVIVDNVAEVITLKNEEISDIPEFNHGTSNNFIHGIGRQKKEVFILLKCAELVKLGITE
ncbi:purine-binding chemotaxis protein CheW [Clostridium sp. 'deep sea']|jgi:purine-binding chemotaxis protein CheW|uniref:chemotaxis protein CheW n=1 Tax=Clostridium sp. 'deep sea' TaxID=2779445 RepID=UPI0018964F7E|nr:chemotaxis protein CheW [Clostridium sp. 'deep sea']QOR35335.1 purine-binding chemotaxis protein CheW [Clostridium sp. 'deep sea']